MKDNPLFVKPDEAIGSNQPQSDVTADDNRTDGTNL